MKKVLTFDRILSVLIIGAALVTDFFLFKFGSLPLQWRIIGMAFVTILAALCFVFTLKKLPDWGIWTRRICSVILVIALVTTSFYISKVNTFTNNITDVKDGSTTISVVVTKDSDIDELADLEDKLVGMNTLADKTNSIYVQDKINAEVENVKYLEDNNYIDLANKLLNKEIDALILSNSYINAASIEDSVPGFSAQLDIIKSWDRITSSKDSMAGNSKLDLVNEPFTVLISGMDDTGTPNHDSRSDVNMLVMVNPQTRFIQMVSFPRDSYVPNPALGNGNDKLTHLGNHGIENLVTGLENTIGFDIDFYAKVNFTSLLEFVDALGGVEVNVPYTFTEQNSKRELNTIHIEKGLQTLDGEEALAFARHRYSAGVGDIGRTKAQQMVLTAIIKKALISPTKIPTLLDIAPKYMVTNITSKQIENFLSYQLDNMGSWKMLSCTLENGYYAGLVTASMGSIPLSCNILGRGDMYTLAQKYELIYNPQTLDQFKFSLNDLDAYVPVASIRPGSNILFSDMDFSQYLGTTETTEPEVDIEDEEGNDDTTETPDTDNGDVETPPTGEEGIIPPTGEEGIVPPPTGEEGIIPPVTEDENLNEGI